MESDREKKPFETSTSTSLSTRVPSVNDEMEHNKVEAQNNNDLTTKPDEKMAVDEKPAEDEYPKGLVLFFILLALMMAIFLASLDMVRSFQIPTA